ncbi:MAG: sigma 54-dependent Fis family transcriptional regulator [Deltaproteobacteria bacterium]|nr:sigma 54-dependent Fis family transcriptional regulator [Deltaproteobacteria bacterium]
MSASKQEPATEVDRRSGSSGPLAFRVTVAQGPDAGASVQIDASNPSSVLVGSSAACQLVLHDPKVSRRHASLDVSEHGLRVVDLGSTNGTTVNGVRVTECVTIGGEVIGIAGSTLHVERLAAGPARITNAVSFGRVIGASLAMRRLYPLFEKLAASSITVVIEGETGTGKELLAEELHDAGPRRSAPFVVFDCSSIAPALVEGVLFGEETPGVSSRGVFEAAHGGTLLIDEITELAPALQRKLLRAIERGEVCRVGTDRWLHVDVRVIATTRRDLEKEVEAGRFREDLYFRLAVGRIELPPLRQRKGDVPLLADYFAKRSGSENGLPPDFLRRYEGYAWPGNVRELHNTVARRLALGDADPDGDGETADDAIDGAPENAFRWVLEQDLPFTSARDLVSTEFERAYVERVLEQHGGNVSRAAAASGLARRYFQILRARQRG